MRLKTSDEIRIQETIGCAIITGLLLGAVALIWLFGAYGLLTIAAIILLTGVLLGRRLARSRRENW